MSLRLEMLQVARLAPRMLGEAAALVVDFLRSQLNPDGAFRDRAGASDLYYTVFGVEALRALNVELPPQPLADYIRGHGDGQSLDFVHVACLARCWANLPESLQGQTPRSAVLERLESFRSRDGGYSASAGAEHGTTYGCFLALGAYQDLGAEPPAKMSMLECLRHLKSADGGYANQDDMPVGLTPSTAAAATLLRHLDHPPEPGLRDWLLSRRYPQGGFYATPLAPLPDLLSTATALHALAGMQLDFGDLKEPCLDFIDSLWTNRGGFYGHWSDDAIDCEYTYYALLALGHLSL